MAAQSEASVPSNGLFSPERQIIKLNPETSQQPPLPESRLPKKPTADRHSPPNHYLPQPRTLDQYTPLNPIEDQHSPLNHFGDHFIPLNPIEDQCTPVQPTFVDQYNPQNLSQNQYSPHNPVVDKYTPLNPITEHSTPRNLTPDKYVPPNPVLSARSSVSIDSQILKIYDFKDRLGIENPLPIESPISLSRESHKGTSVMAAPSELSVPTNGIITT